MKLVRWKDRIAQYRKEHDITQEELARRLNVAKQTVSAWEVGRSSPVLGDIESIAEKMGVSTAWLFGLDVDSKRYDDECIDFAKAKYEDRQIMTSAPKENINGVDYPVLNHDEGIKHMKVVEAAYELYIKGKMTREAFFEMIKAAE